MERTSRKKPHSPHLKPKKTFAFYWRQMWMDSIKRVATFLSRVLAADQIWRVSLNEIWNWISLKIPVVDHFLAAIYVIVLNWITSGPCKWSISCRKHVFTILSSIFGKFTCKLKARANLSYQSMFHRNRVIFFTQNKGTRKNENICRNVL